MSFLMTFSVLIMLAALLATILFLLSLRGDGSYARLGWGIYPIILAMASIFVIGASTPRLLLMFVLILTLCSQYLISFRHREDGRQSQISLNLYLKSFLLKSFYAVVMMIPIVLVVSTPYSPPLGVVDIAGSIIWGLGFLYRYSHGELANRQGEALQWWGVWVISLSTAYGIFGIISPIVATGVVYWSQRKYQSK